MPIHPYSNTNSAQGSEHRHSSVSPLHFQAYRALSPPAPVFHRSSSPQQLIITKSSVNSIL